MHSAVAGTAKCNQVLLDILPGEAAKFFVVNFQVRHRAAQLTAPAIAPQYLFAEILITFLVKPDRRLLRRSYTH